MNSFILFVFSVCILFNAIESTDNRGMTWAVNSGRYDPILNLDAVSCSNCNAYDGDTYCKNKLPILCVSSCNFKRPPYNPIGCTTCAIRPPDAPSFYDGWSGGMFKLSSPVLGLSLLSSGNMNKICQQQFGSSFIAAEHHIGKYVPGMSSTTFFYNTWPTTTRSGGWGARGYGNLNTTSRFWVYIDGQPANCWNP